MTQLLDAWELLPSHILLRQGTSADRSASAGRSFLSSQVESKAIADQVGRGFESYKIQSSQPLVLAVGHKRIVLMPINLEAKAEPVLQ